MADTGILAEYLAARYDLPPFGDESAVDYGLALAVACVTGDLSGERLRKLLGSEYKEMSVKANDVLGHVRAKDAAEQYETKRVAGVHVKTQQPVDNPFTGRPAEHNSRFDNARVGVLMKHLAQRSGLFPGLSLPEHERALLAEMAHDDWAGRVDGEYKEKISGGRVKALIDDATSGGLEVTPVFFDDQIVTIPLLTGELLPRVDLRPIPRGRRIEGASVGTPTVSWGQGDDAECSLFDTTDLVSALDSTVFGCAVCIQVGRDFLSDAGADVGQLLTGLIGERMAAELDKMIAVGNGTSQPEGVENATGLNTCNTDNGAAGPPTVDDYTSLLFSVGKQYRSPAMRPAFLSNDTTFQRSRQIAIDTATPSTDQRPALAPLTAINKYETLGWPHAVQNDVGNRTAVFGAMSKYRLYRRQGMEVQWVQGGETLARKNLVLLVVRARYAGRVVDPDAFAIWQDGQS